MLPPYDELTIVPSLIAESVTNEVYTGRELSDALRPGAERVRRIEEKRRAMSLELRQRFCRHADERCRVAYESGARWFTKCLDANGNAGRDQLYNFMRHWLAAFLMFNEDS